MKKKSSVGKKSEGSLEEAPSCGGESSAHNISLRSDDLERVKQLFATPEKKLSTATSDKNVKPIGLRSGIKQAQKAELNARDVNVISEPEPLTTTATPLDKNDPSILNRTVFVGNVPISVKNGSTLLKMFGVQDNPDIQSCRLRSIPVVEKFQSNVLAGVARGDYSPHGYSQNAYILVREAAAPSTMKALLDFNATKIEDHFIRVTRLNETGQFSKFDRKRTVCVRFMPPEANEDNVRKHFASETDVLNVRLIRDALTRRIKGFGFIMFRERKDVKKAIEMFNGKNFRGSKIEVTKALAEDETTHKRKADESYAGARKRSGSQASNYFNKRKADESYGGARKRSGSQVSNYSNKRKADETYSGARKRSGSQVLNTSDSRKREDGGPTKKRRRLLQKS